MYNTNSIFAAIKPFSSTAAETATTVTVSVQCVRSVYKLLVVSPNDDDNILMNLIVVK